MLNDTILSNLHTSSDYAIIKLLIRCIIFCCEAKQKILKTWLSIYVNAGQHKIQLKYRIFFLSNFDCTKIVNTY